VPNTKWLDRSHPQTLYLATVLLYVNAAYWLLYMLLLGQFILGALGVGAVFAALGMASEKKIGYWGALVVAGLNLVMVGAIFWLAKGQSISVVLNLMFAVALVALLVHPMTRSYVRIWFRKLDRLERRR
jgi:hypothetical protein